MNQSDPHRRGLVLRFLRECVRPYLGLQVEIGVCLLVGVVLELLDPLILRAVIDHALGDGNFSLLLVLVGILAIALLFRVAFRLISVWLYSYSGLRILFDFRQRAFEHAERLSPFFYRGQHLGDILARLTSDIDVLQRAAAHTLVNAVHDGLTITAIVALLAWLDPQLTLVLVLGYPLLVFALSRVNKHLRAEAWNARESVARLFSFLEERLAGVRLVQEFSREKAEARLHVRTSRPWIQSNLKLSFLGALQNSLGDLVATGAFILVFLLGGARTLQGALTLGSLIAYYTLATRLYRPVSGLIGINVDLQVARASLGRLYDLLDTEPEIQEAAEPVSPASVEGRIDLRGVCFAWSRAERVLDDIDLAVEPGQVVAIAGPSGSGKSTLAALIARYLDPQHGRVSLDEVDVRQWRIRALRRAISYVPQETQMFHDTLAANLRLARPGATPEELRDALETVELGPFLAGLPEGLETMVGAQGLRLSGGERQRLALARALLKDSPITILDEATSALDLLTERRVLSRFFERAHNRTTVIIAHRLTSIADADQIFLLDRGRLVGSGTHTELHSSSEFYRQLYDDQLPLRTPLRRTHH